MATITTSTNLFPVELVPEIFTKVKGHSALAKLSGQSPIRFVGTQQFVFSMDGEASIVGEGENKPAGDAAFTTVTITPIKFVYQHRLTDEFIHMAEEQQVPYLQAFGEGFATKIARALDIAAFHGIDPASKAAVASLATRNFDGLLNPASGTKYVVTYNSATPDDNIDTAVQQIIAANGDVTGIAMSPTFGAAMGAMKDETGSNRALYPEFRFGQNPNAFAGMGIDVNPTVNFNTAADMAIVGDFQRAFKWGYASNIPMEVIEYGDPDGQGDLKRKNQICLRAEAYIGWGILDAASFRLIQVQAQAGNG